MKPQNMKKAYEWVLTPEKGDDIVLTENQYELYRTQIQEENFSPIFYDEVEVRPYKIVTAIRREASAIKRKYPCRKCNTNGFLFEKDEDGVFLLCPECEGTGTIAKS